MSNDDEFELKLRAKIVRDTKHGGSRAFPAGGWAIEVITNNGTRSGDVCGNRAQTIKSLLKFLIDKPSLSN